MQTPTPDKKRYYFKHLDFPGTWKVIWFGRLSRLNEGSDAVSIYVYVGKLISLAQNTYAQPLEYKRVSLPIGDFPVLYIGAVLENGTLLHSEELPSQFCKTYDIKIDLTKENIKATPRMARDDAGYLVSATRQWGFYQEPQADSYLLGFNHNDNPYGIIIPCAEVLRFFYCYASNMAKVMTSDRILNPGRWLYDPQKTSFDAKTGTVVLKPRLTVSRSSALYLANFISGYFKLERAQQIPAQVAVISRMEPERPFVVFPPLDGPCLINASYHTHENHLGKQIIISRIISADLQPNFNAIAMGHSKEIEGQEKERRSPAKNKKIKIRNRSDHPVRLNPGAINPSLGVEENFDDELGERFPKMAEVVQFPSLEKKHQSDPGAEHVNTRHPDGSTNDKSSSDSDLHRTIILPNESHQDDDDLSAFERIVKAMELIKSASLAEVKFLKLTQLFEKVDDSDDGVVYNMPNLEHTELWVYIDNTHVRRRRILIASLVKDSVKRFLVEFEQKNWGECPTLVIWNADSEVSDQDVLFAVTECIKNEAIYIDNRSFEHSWSKLRHSWKKNEHIKPDHFLGRIFSAERSMNKI